MFAVKHSPFDMVPQVRKRGEDGRKRPAAVMVKQSWHVLEQKIRRPSGFSQAGNFKEESTSCIVKSFSAASERKRLAGESPTQKVEVGQVVGVNGSGVWIVSLLLPDVVDRAVTGFGILSISQCPTHWKPPTRVSPARKPPIPANISKYRIRWYHLPPAAHGESRGRPHRRPRPAPAA